MKQWLKDLFGPGTTASAGRVFLAIHSLSGIAWVSYLVQKNHVLPDLAGITAFVVAPYVATKGAEVITSIKNGNGK